MGKRGGWGVSPAYYAGKVFSMGTTGLLYCYDSKTGKKVWESDIGKTHQAWEADKKQRLEKRILPPSGQLVSLVVADGVLIVPLYDGGDMSLRGVDTADGKTLWEVAAATAHSATPALWRHEGREYVLAATHGNPAKRDAKLRLINPKTGKVLWTVDGLCNTHFALAPSEKHVLVNVGSRTLHSGDTPFMLMGCYRLSLEGAKRVWTMPDELESWYEGAFEASCWRKSLIHDGKVHYYSFAKDGGKMTIVFSILEEETGKILYRKRGDAASFGQQYFVEDRLLDIPDASHKNPTFRLWNADPKDLRLLSRWTPPHPGTTAYEVFMEFPCVDGRIFTRARDGTVRGYDLRAQTK
jgi:hypothetical protein